jgi:TolB-like protein
MVLVYNKLKYLKMKVLFGLLITIALNISSISGQEKIGVGIMPFTYVSGSASGQDVNSIQETVTNAFVKTRRFNIVDRTKMDALRREKDLQKSEDFIDGTVIQQGVSLGANYLISGHVLSVSTERFTSKEGTQSFSTKLNIDLKVIDVATGEVIASETLTPKGGSSLFGFMGVGASSEAEAMNNAIKDIGDEVDKFVGKHFPVSFPIVEVVEKDSRGGAAKLLIAGGSSFGLKKGDKLVAVEVTEVEVNGKKLKRKKEIGELKVSKVEDENFSVCTINSGGTEIFARFISKMNVQIITKD